MDIEDKVKHAFNISKEKIDSHKTCPDAAEWNDFMDEKIHPVVLLAEHDVRDACRRISSVKTAEAKKAQADKENGNDGKGSDVDQQDSQESDEESG